MTPQSHPGQDMTLLGMTPQSHPVQPPTLTPLNHPVNDETSGTTRVTLISEFELSGRGRGK
jgi:hypothetical protein